jgi:hypothetical protein
VRRPRFADSHAGRTGPDSRTAGRRLLTGASALGLLVGAGGAAHASASTNLLPAATAISIPAGKALPSDDCIGDAQGMMTMPDGMKMPAADMPGCAAVKSSTPGAGTDTSSHAGPKQVQAGTGGQTSTPQHVHAGTGGQAGWDSSADVPVAPLGLVLAGLGVGAAACRRLSRG